MASSLGAIRTPWAAGGHGGGPAERPAGRRCAAARARQPRVACSAENQPQGDGTPPPPGPSLSADPVETIVWGGRLPTRRRVLGGTGLAAGIALGANFGGVTSALLGTQEDGARALRLDAWVPINGYKRCYDKDNGYEFLYPSTWLADQTLYRRQAARVEQMAALDPQPVRRMRQRNVAEPTAAYGPAGTTGEENVSVVVAPIMAGFALEQLGPPETAADFFLNKTIAPPGSNKEAALIRATQKTDELGQLYYELEYTVKTTKWERHNASSICAAGNLLYTINVQCPEKKWAEQEATLRRSVDTFRVLEGVASPPDVPQTLGRY